MAKERHQHFTQYDHRQDSDGKPHQAKGRYERIDQPRLAWSEDGAGAARQVSLRTPEWKVIRRGEASEAFELSSDALERKSRPDDAPRALALRLEELLRERPLERPGAEGAFDAATREQLRLLGYVR